jgi:hypothetical protein
MRSSHRPALRYPWSSSAKYHGENATNRPGINKRAEEESEDKTEAPILAKQSGEQILSIGLQSNALRHVRKFHVWFPERTPLLFRIS